MATSALIVAVGTPSDEDGSANLKHVPATPCRLQNSAKWRTSIEFTASRSVSDRCEQFKRSWCVQPGRSAVWASVWSFTRI